MKDVPTVQVGPVHVLAPGRDGELACRVLAAQGIACARSRNPEALRHSLSDDTGAVLLAEEEVDQGLLRWLRDLIQCQPPWSDLPVLVVVQQHRHRLPAQVLSALGNVTILTRPMAVPDLISTVGSALRARARQFEVRQLLAQQAEQGRRKDEFLAMLAHELRNPLAPVRYAAHALRGEALSPRALHLTDVIERQVGHMGRLIAQLVDVSRLTRGLIRLDRAPMDLCALARSCLEAREAAARDAGVSLRLQAHAPVWVDGDATRLKQVLENLLDNAIKFSPAGSEVVVEAGVRDRWAALEVRDQGDGIQAADIPHVFQPLVQADRSLDRAGGGIGLGLAMVKGLVELHGGRVSVKSDGASRGSSFFVELPSIAAPAQAAAPSPDAPLAANGCVRVLLAEDNTDAADILRMLLESYGYTVSVASSGPAAVQAAREERPDALLCDIGLPGMDGYEVARALRAQPGMQDLLMIAITGYAASQDRAAAAAAGFDMHLPKPVDPVLLLAELRKLQRARSPANDNRMHPARQSE